MDKYIISQNLMISLVADNSVNNLMLSVNNLGATQLNMPSTDLIITRFLKNPQVEVFLQDFPITTFPEELTSQLLTDLEKNLLIRNNEWQATNRIYLEVLQRDPQRSSQWQTIGACIAVNRDNSPYPLAGFSRAIKAMDGEVILGATTEIGIRVQPSRPLSSVDRLIFTALYQEEVFIRPKNDRILNCTNQSWSVPSTGIQVLPSQSNRASFRITNNGNARIWLNLGTLNGINTGDPIQPNDFREYSAYDNDRYTLPVWLISETGNQQVSGVTCFY